MLTSPSIPVTVLLAVRNEERFVAAAVASILGQSFQPFEFVIVDDASTDGTAAFLAALSDPRVRVVRNPEPLGLTRSLVRGMGEARGDLVARMDADDLSAPDRLARQVAYLAQHAEVGVLGSACRVMDESGKRVGFRKMPEDDRAIRWRSLLDNPFVHPVVMFRRDVYERAGGYDPACGVAQDYDLWTRMLRTTQGCNLPQPLLDYRQRGGAVTGTRRAEQLATHDRIAWRTLNEVLPGAGVSAEEWQQVRALMAGGGPDVPAARVAGRVRTYWRVLTLFRRSRALPPGFSSVIRRERLRCLHRLFFRGRGPGRLLTACELCGWRKPGGGK